MDRDAMIAECAAWYGVHPSLFRRLDQAVLEQAWHTARAHWSSLPVPG